MNYKVHVNTKIYKKFHFQDVTKAAFQVLTFSRETKRGRYNLPGSKSIKGVILVVSFVVYHQHDTGIKPEEVLQASFNRGVGGLGFLAAFPLPLPGLSTNTTGQVVLL